MRAAVLTAHHGTPVLAQRDEPRPGDGQAVVAVAAAPITPLDLLCATGTSYFGPPSLPYVPGVQGVGRVVSSRRLAVGSRVWFPTRAGMAPGDGALADLAVCGEDDLVPIVADVPDAAVAALGLSAVAAWMCLTWRAALAPEERVLILGAGGAVGQVALQAARLLGASAVHGACRSDASRLRAAQRTTDVIVRLGDAQDAEELADRIRSECGEVDVVIDPLGGLPSTAALRCLAPGGRLVNLGASAGDAATFSSAHLRSGNRSVLGYTNNSLTAEQRQDAFGQVLDLAGEGLLSVDHENVPLEQAGQAWRRQAESTGPRMVVSIDAPW